MPDYPVVATIRSGGDERYNTPTGDEDSNSVAALLAYLFGSVPPDEWADSSDVEEIDLPWAGFPGGGEKPVPASDAPFGGGKHCRDCLNAAAMGGAAREAFCAKTFSGQKELYTKCVVESQGGKTVFANWCRWAVCTPGQAIKG